MTQNPQSGVEPDRIDVNDPQACAEWASRLDCTQAQLREAVKAVGNQAGDVEMHLHGVHSTTNSDRVHDADEDN